MFHDYAVSGSWDEQTLSDNSTDFKKIRLRQRVAVDMTDRKTNSEMINEPVTIPVALAPVGLTGMQRADGEIKAAKAAEIKRTSEAYKRGEFIDIKAVQKSRVKQDGSKSKTTKRKRKKKS